MISSNFIKCDFKVLLIRFFPAYKRPGIWIQFFLRALALIIIFLFFQSPVYSSDKLDTIILDAGHGGKDPGTIGLNGTKEKDINFAVTMLLGDLIHKAFPLINIVYIRTKDDFIDVHEHSVIANNSKAKLYICIHSNHKKEDELNKNGFEVYLLNRERFPEAVSITLTDNKNLNIDKSADENSQFIFSSLAQIGYQKFSQMFSADIESNLLDLTKLRSRGVMQEGFWVLVASSMPSVLVECGYLSDPQDERYLNSPEGKQSVALALFQAFTAYKLQYESR